MVAARSGVSDGHAGQRVVIEPNIACFLPAVRTWSIISQADR